MARRCIVERFMEKVAPEPNTGCWLWTASVNRDGYGYFCVGVGRVNAKAHRVSYELAHGRIPVGACVMHRCDTPSCVNPDHLSLGTAADNNRDKKAKGRASGGERHARIMRRVSHKGSSNPSAKLTESSVLAIHDHYRAGLTQKEIAAKYGVSQPLISAVLRGAAWKHTHPTRPTAEARGVATEE